MQAARHLVAVAPTKLAAGTKHGEHHLCCALALVLTRWVWVDGNTTTVVLNPTTAIGQENDRNAVAKTSHGFID